MIQPSDLEPVLTWLHSKHLSTSIIVYSCSDILKKQSGLDGIIEEIPLQTNSLEELIFATAHPAHMTFKT